MSTTDAPALAGFLRSQHWDAFFTSTFARQERFSWTAIERVQHKLLSPRLRPTKTFIAAEQHRLGGWHCHGLVKWPTGHVDNPFLIASLGYLLGELGFNVVSSVDNVDACSAYLSKYLTKDEFHGDWRMTGRKRYWTSH